MNMRKFAGQAGLGLAWTLWAVCATAAGPGVADADTRSMIEALMPKAQRARNLVVRIKPEAAAASAAVAAASAASGAEPATMAAAEPAAATPPAPAPVPAGPAPSLSLAIQFEPNSSRVRPESGAMLGTLVAAMQSPELKTARFVIEGHSDARGATAQNQRLSLERAEEVRLYLVALGVHPSRLKAVGKGSSELADAADPGAAANRRVRVVTIE